MRLRALALAALLAASTASADWPEIVSSWHEIQNPAAVLAPPTCTVAGQVGIFLGSPLALGCGTLSWDGSTLTFGTGAALGSIAASTLRIGPPNVTGATPPAAQTVRFQDVGTTATADLAGANATIRGSLGKGTAASGKIIFTIGTPQLTTVAHVPAEALTLQNTGTGGTAAPQALFADGTAAKPSVASVAYPTTGLFWDANPGLNFSAGTVKRATLYAGSFDVFTGSFGLHSAAATNPVWLTVPAAATLQLGAVAANADGVDQRLQTQGGITGTDRAAGDLDLTTGLGTGTGYSKVTISAPTRVGTGTTAQTRAVRVTVSDIGVQWATGTRPTCDAAARGSVWYVAGGAGVADTFEICGKAAADTYSWVALATF